MARVLSNLKTIDIRRCDGMEEVVSDRDDTDEDKKTDLFPHLHSLSFHDLTNLKRIGGGGGDSTNLIHDQFKRIGGSGEDTTNLIHDQYKLIIPWSLCQYPKEIQIESCDALSSLIPCYALEKMQKLEVLEVKYCYSLMDIFETQGINNNRDRGSSTTKIDEGISGVPHTIPRPENINVPQLYNLKKLVISYCNLLRHVFTFSTLESLKQLENLMIKDCEAMEVIVMKEYSQQRKVVVFPRLKSILPSNLPNPGADVVKRGGVMISQCPQMMVFTYGRLTTPMLKYMHTSLGKHSLECGLNFHQTWLASSKSTSLERLPWSFYNLIEVHMEFNYDVKNIIPSTELLQLQKLEKIGVYYCGYVEEVFEVVEMEGINKSFDVFEIPNLRQMELKLLESLKYIWKSNHYGTTLLKFPNLTTLSIDSCTSLKHVFTSPMVSSLLQLQDLTVSNCKNMEVIVKEEEEEYIERDAKVKVIVLRCLKSLKLELLRSLEGFCLGKEEFSWPSLDTLEIKRCPEISVFTKGQSATPTLNIIDTSFGRCYVKEDLNSFIQTKQHEGFRF
ncbi:hypothetical protein L1987_39625 [Smallanthus sonchifolius]|uniref:Uncharacterized protein n=1 Tax=Smallanthus sonchifolius TaxID=185202 RepID=A0ACB9HNP3_9ASTR|nr:hypothetical protein L1987_39625 [Smallanthus sonchifolius]